jgi:hypothetical protein
MDLPPFINWPFFRCFGLVVAVVFSNFSSSISSYLKFYAKRLRNVGSAIGYKLTIDAIVSCYKSTLVFDFVSSRLFCFIEHPVSIRYEFAFPVCLIWE